MLNKELILYGSADLPYTHTMRVGRDETNNYLFIGTLNGNLSPNTVFINDHSIEVGGIYSGYEKYNNLDYWQLFFLIKWYSPVSPLYLGRADTREVVYCDGGDYDTGFIEYNTYAKDVKFTEEDVGKDIHLWIATTPPLGHKTSQEHLTEESVDDKQRITDDVECGKFYNCHGKLLRKTFDNFKVQNNGQSNRKDILRRQCSTSLLKNGVRKSPCKHSSIPMDKCWSYRVSWYRTSKYPLRARVGEHNLRIHKRSRLYCQCVYSSVVVVQEALYA